ncbi:MAG: hypothetical protein Q9188_001718 [Gyalolechia gomerana]
MGEPWIFPRHNVKPDLDDNEEIRNHIDASVATLNRLLFGGKTVYGVTTGLGGSADTRTADTEALQSALLQHQHFGVLAKADKGMDKHLSTSQYSHAMPSEWVKGTMLTRCNTVARGHSAVTLRVIKTIVALLQNNHTPVVPLRGSISASGDLSPLSYIAGAITGNPDVYVQGPAGVFSAEQALREIDIEPVVLGPKEGLGLINGTATSAAVASLAIYEAHHLTILSQVLTAMAVEALIGTVSSFDPFIARIRPHRGQMESAATIRQFLQGSRLALGFDFDEDVRQSAGELYQDRYALRTASQWIGPQLEDLLLAHEQVTTELNSTTDNPLVDVSEQAIHHGGNFQAVSLTSAMEKTRLSLQMLGKLLFAQSSELLNPMLNHGLPPNLAADEPSKSFTMKGVDIGMASYMSELGYLANPVSSHVQSAEMHNQAVNSLALISGRYTMQSVDLVSLMSASHLYAVCQALDLRVLERTFFHNVGPALHATNRKILGQLLSLAAIDSFHTKLCAHVQTMWRSISNKDTHDRVPCIVDRAVSILTQSLTENPQGSLQEAISTIQSWKLQASSILAATYTNTRAAFFVHQTTADYLGRASKPMYLFVRETLGVPFHKGLEDHPTPKGPASTDGSRKQTIGSWIGVIYESLRSGQLHGPLMDCLVEGGLVPNEGPAHGTREYDVAADGRVSKDFGNGHSPNNLSKGTVIQQSEPVNSRPLEAVSIGSRDYQRVNGNTNDGTEGLPS